VDAGFLERLLGGNRIWSGPCTVILDADAAVNTPGPDSIITGGQKSYAPRVSCGRMNADAVFLLKDEQVLLSVEEVRFKDATGQSRVKRTLAVLDLRHIVGVEFGNLHPLKALGVDEPPPIKELEYRPTTLVG
jgi:hypothetical protein